MLGANTSMSITTMTAGTTIIMTRAGTITTIMRPDITITTTMTTLIIT